MNQKKFDKLYQHYIKHFGADKEPMIFHNIVDNPGALHIDVVHLAPTEDRPFQVLATIGASDYAMRRRPALPPGVRGYECAPLQDRPA